MNTILHGPAYSVYVCAARLALIEKGVAFTFDRFDLAAITDQQHARHPFGKVPTLTHGSLVLAETSVIERYIDEAFQGPPLQPQDARSRARMNAAIAFADAYGYRPMVHGVFVARMRAPGRGIKVDEESVSRSLSESCRCLDALAAIQGGDDFIAGSSLSLADTHLFPMIETFAAAPEGREAIAVRPGLTRWLAHMRERNSIRQIDDFFL